MARVPIAILVSLDSIFPTHPSATACSREILKLRFGAIRSVRRTCSELVSFATAAVTYFTFEWPPMAPMALPVKFQIWQWGGQALHAMWLLLPLFRDTLPPCPKGAGDKISNGFQYFQRMILASVLYRLRIGSGFTSKRVTRNILVATVY